MEFPTWIRGCCYCVVSWFDYYTDRGCCYCVVSWFDYYTDRGCCYCVVSWFNYYTDRGCCYCVVSWFDYYTDRGCCYCVVSWFDYYTDRGCCYCVVSWFDYYIDRGCCYCVVSWFDYYTDRGCCYCVVSWFDYYTDRGCCYCVVSWFNYYTDVETNALINKVQHHKSLFLFQTSEAITLQCLFITSNRENSQLQKQSWLRMVLQLPTGYVKPAFTSHQSYKKNMTGSLRDTDIEHFWSGTMLSCVFINKLRKKRISPCLCVKIAFLWNQSSENVSPSCNWVEFCKSNFASCNLHFFTNVLCQACLFAQAHSQHNMLVYTSLPMCYVKPACSFMLTHNIVCLFTLLYQCVMPSLLVCSCSLTT